MIIYYRYIIENATMDFISFGTDLTIARTSYNENNDGRFKVYLEGRENPDLDLPLINNGSVLEYYTLNG